MRYIDGFVIPVPTAKKEAYREMAAAFSASIFPNSRVDRLMPPPAASASRRAAR